MICSAQRWRLREATGSVAVPVEEATSGLDAMETAVAAEDEVAAAAAVVAAAATAAAAAVAESQMRNTCTRSTICRRRYTSPRRRDTPNRECPNSRMRGKDAGATDEARSSNARSVRHRPASKSCDKAEAAGAAAKEGAAT